MAQTRRRSTQPDRLTIGAVIAALREDFPDVSVSKLRFLEAAGLVHPARTASGYRVYALSDVERIRYVLTAQRERFWPLRVIREALDAMEEPFLAECTRRLLSDEVLHGQFGFHYLEAWQPWLARRPEVCESVERYLRGALAVIERELAGTSPHPWTVTDEERALGCPDPARAREVFHTTLEGAVLPSLERYGIRAQRAWRERRAPDAP